MLHPASVTIAELLVLGAILALLIWLLRPLQRLVRNGLERWTLRRRYGKVIEGRFRATEVRSRESDTDTNSDPRPH